MLRTINSIIFYFIFIHQLAPHVCSHPGSNVKTYNTRHSLLVIPPTNTISTCENIKLVFNRSTHECVTWLIIIEVMKEQTGAVLVQS